MVGLSGPDRPSLRIRNRVFTMLMRKGLLTPERVKLMRSWAHSGFNVNAAVRIGAGDATGREKIPLGPVLLSDDAPHAKAARASRARFIKKVFAADPLLCPGLWRRGSLSHRGAHRGSPGFLGCFTG